ncbi:hypothetical protein [Cellulosimicrobium sp. Marseille-Q4280]|uniref:hypothetical protein n=1 Tax=Cellulosimicrobium sp. Marseille-Q4280 TaxID=2937992 RepID=UPI00203AD852|nr:hypothetical protein [Cellulosimicrobium sp. Marseille-Q4280]
MAYAADTTVTISRSKDEIERIVTRYGATAFMIGWAAGGAAVRFDMRERRIQFLLHLPDVESFRSTPTGQSRSASAAKAAADKEHRRLWRALGLVIKAKLEAVESGIVTFDQELGMHFVLPNDQTVYDAVRPGIEAAYEHGDMAPLLQIGRG